MIFKGYSLIIEIGTAIYIWEWHLVEPEIIDLRDKQLEQAIVGISAKIATVIEMTQKGKAVSADSLTVLIQIQMELEDLYIQLNQYKKGFPKMMILR